MQIIMTKQIWKFQLETTMRQSILMPSEAEILDVQLQHSKPCIWALVDPKAEQVERTFEIFGTGQEITYDMGVERNYLGTFQAQGGIYIFHVFERIN